ncbi:MAG: lpg1639 family Dot/Icm T4SS effector [Rhodospirillales bacterium]
MPLDIMTTAPVGDKRNSDFFNEYRLKIYERRRSSGLEDLLGNLRGIIVQVEQGDGLAYLSELILMSPYRLDCTRRNATHRIFFLRASDAQPRMIVLEPLSTTYEDDTTRFNMLYPRARAKPNARYIGELFATQNLAETQRILTAHEIRFHSAEEEGNAFFANEHFRFTYPSDFTGNRIGYSALDLNDVDAIGAGEALELSSAEAEQLAAAEAKVEATGLSDLILGADHMATRILSGEREDAILEFLTMSNYYFWGAYNIADMNSSTNVNRNPHVTDEKLSPAKVFTANNTPSFVNSFEGLPMPTENFVRNFGRRMHHIAYEVRDGDHASGQKNIDYVVEELRRLGVPFLAHIVGACGEEPDLKQIFSKHSEFSILITEYVERCHGYQGFFTKQNVAALTEAAGLDERFEHGHVFD